MRKQICVESKVRIQLQLGTVANTKQYFQLRKININSYTYHQLLFWDLQTKQERCYCINSNIISPSKNEKKKKEKVSEMKVTKDRY